MASIAANVLTTIWKERDESKAIRDIGISETEAAWLNSQGIETVEALTQKSATEIMNLPGHEPGYMVPILAALANESLCLAGWDYPTMIQALENLVGFPITPGSLLSQIHEHHLDFAAIMKEKAELTKKMFSQSIPPGHRLQ